MVQQEEELELVRTEVYPLRNAHLQPRSNFRFELGTREYPGIGHHLSLTVAIGQIFHQFELIRQAFLDLIAQHPQIIRKLYEVNILLIGLFGLHLFKDSHIDVLKLTALKHRRLGLLLLHQTVVQHQGLAGEPAPQLERTADGELKTAERVSLVETLAVGLEKSTGHLPPDLDVLQLEDQLAGGLRLPHPHPIHEDVRLNRALILG